jgi:hypothetical protein
MTEPPKPSQHPDMSSEGMLARLERLGLGDDLMLGGEHRMGVDFRGR